MMMLMARRVIRRRLHNLYVCLPCSNYKSLQAVVCCESVDPIAVAVICSNAAINSST